MVLFQYIVFYCYLCLIRIPPGELSLVATEIAFHGGRIFIGLADAFHHADIIVDIEAVVPPLKADVAVFHYKIIGSIRDMECVHRGGDPIALFGSGMQPDGDAGKEHMVGASSLHVLLFIYIFAGISIF